MIRIVSGLLLCLMCGPVWAACDQGDEGCKEIEKGMKEAGDRINAEMAKTAKYRDACEQVASTYGIKQENNHPELPSLIKLCNADPAHDECQTYDEIVVATRGLHIFSCGKP